MTFILKIWDHNHYRYYKKYFLEFKKGDEVIITANNASYKLKPNTIGVVKAVKKNKCKVKFRGKKKAVEVSVFDIKLVADVGSGDAEGNFALNCINALTARKNIKLQKKGLKPMLKIAKYKEKLFKMLRKVKQCLNKKVF